MRHSLCGKMTQTAPVPPAFSRTKCSNRASWMSARFSCRGLPRKSMAPVAFGLGLACSRAAAYHFYPFAGGQPPMTLLLAALSTDNDEGYLRVGGSLL